jgi:KipI family sensor histidine kinase inhibitor
VSTLLLPRFLDAGEAALVVEFGSSVDSATHDRMLALDAALGVANLDGVIETVPTYRSLMIHYDPLIVDRAALIAAISSLTVAGSASRRPSSLWSIPCCYEGALGEDIGEIADRVNLSRDEVVRLHSRAPYRIYMYGFAPGFCYLGGLPEALGVSRRPAPRLPTPPNVVLLAGGLSLITTVSMPTGWWIIGTTPERMFAPHREPMFLAEVGDQIRFEPIDRATFDLLEERATGGEVVARRSAA